MKTYDFMEPRVVMEEGIIVAADDPQGQRFRFRLSIPWLHSIAPLSNVTKEALLAHYETHEDEIEERMIQRMIDVMDEGQKPGEVIELDFVV